MTICIRCGSGSIFHSTENDYNYCQNCWENKQLETVFKEGVMVNARRGSKKFVYQIQSVHFGNKNTFCHIMRVQEMFPSGFMSNIRNLLYCDVVWASCTFCMSKFALNNNQKVFQPCGCGAIEIETEQASQIQLMLEERV